MLFQCSKPHTFEDFSSIDKCKADLYSHIIGFLANVEYYKDLFRSSGAYVFLILFYINLKFLKKKLALNGFTKKKKQEKNKTKKKKKLTRNKIKKKSFRNLDHLIKGKIFFNQLFLT